MTEWSRQEAWLGDLHRKPEVTSATIWVAGWSFENEVPLTFLSSPTFWCRWASPTSTSASHIERSWKYKHCFCHIGSPDWESLPRLSKAVEEVFTGVCSITVKGLCEDASKYFPTVEVSSNPKSRGVLVSSHPHFFSVSLTKRIFAKSHLCSRPLGFMRNQSQIQNRNSCVTVREDKEDPYWANILHFKAKVLQEMKKQKIYYRG